MPANPSTDKSKNAPKDKDNPSKDRTARRIGFILPRSTVEFFRRLLRFSGSREDPRVWLGYRVLWALAAGLVLMFLYLIIFNPIADVFTASLAFGLFFGSLLVILGFSYISLYYRISERSAHMEVILPDFLLLAASNLRAGMSPFAAFVSAARPDFGAFYGEVMLSTARSGGKTPLQNALIEISSYFDSQVLRRSVNLFAKGLRSGGHLAKLLISIAQEVRRIQDLRDELSTSTRTYTIFLAFILIIVMPFLLSISTHFVTVFLKINAETMAGGGDSGAASSANIPVFSGKLSITTNDMVLISLSAITSTSFFVSLLTGIISRGKATYGIKYFPLLAGASCLFYFIAKAGIETFLSAFGA